MKQYPEAIKIESGNKVGWRFYRTRKEAKAAASIARSRAADLERRGYDWGYQVPGQITKTDDGLFRVTIP